MKTLLPAHVFQGLLPDRRQLAPLLLAALEALLAVRPHNADDPEQAAAWQWAESLVRLVDPGWQPPPAPSLEERWTLS